MQFMEELSKSKRKYNFWNVKFRILPKWKTQITKTKTRIRKNLVKMTKIKAKIKKLKTGV